MTVKVGITCGGDVWEPERIRFVEDSGFDAYGTGEHIVYHRGILDAVTILTNAATLTSRVEIIPTTLILPLRHPTMVAKEFADLDVISKGRVTLTVGVGGDYPREFAACGVPMNERGKRVNESIEIIRKYWAGGRFDYAGEIFQLEDADMLPLPVQPGGPRIWVSGRQDGPMRRAARMGDGWHPYMYEPDRFRSSVARVREMAEEAGRTLPEDFVNAAFVYVSLYDDVAEARRHGGEELTFRYDQDFSDLVDRYCAYGPPARVIERLAEYVEAGASYILFGLAMPPEHRQAGLERFAKDVLPTLQKLTPPRST